MKKILLIFLLLTGQAYASCHELGCYKFQVMGSWQIDTVNRRNFIAPAETHQIECWVTRPNTNVKNPNMEIWECTANQAKYDAVDADTNFSILFSEQKAMVYSCSNPTYLTQIDCEAQDCTANPMGGAPICQARGTWGGTEQWQ